MGLVEVLGRLRELLKRRKLLIQTLIDEKPDVFIGIDAPDFTLNIELKLRQVGIKTVHYVSPSVWAWRQKRVLEDSRRLRPMPTLLPFEARFYEEQGYRCALSVTRWPTPYRWKPTARQHVLRWACARGRWLH